MWTELKDLTIEACAGLTTAMVARLVPQLPKLENIWLPYQVIQSDNELNLSDSVRAQLSVRQPPINLQFFPESNDEDECAYVKEYYEKQKKQWIYFNTC